MTKQTAVKLGLCMLAMVVAVGCATAAKGPSDEEQIQSVLGKWSDSITAKNIDQLMTLYSENYKSDDGNTKADVKEFLQGAVDEGYLDDAKVDLATTQIVIEGDKATASPVDLSSPRGSYPVGLVLAKENGQWLIVGMSEA